MSSNKRSFDWLGVPATGSSSKRPKSPAPQAASSNVSNSNLPNASQPTNSPSTSFSTNVPRPQAPVGGQPNSTGHAMLSTLKGSMKLFRKGCEAFPPLKKPVDTLINALETIKITEKGSEELRETVSDLAQWATVLSDYLSDSQPDQNRQITDFVKKIEEDLAEQAKCFQAQQKGGKLRRLLESGQEIEALERCYRRIETSFHQLQADAAIRTWKIADDHLKESRLNAMNPAHDARYNSSFADKIERRACFQNTRGSVLAGIRSWIYGDAGAKIHWTNGMAGTGKTTITYSVCVELERDKRLGASFFCSRASFDCSDVSRILPTIAYQLAQKFYPFRSRLCRILGQNPNIGQCNISEQFEHLIHTPLIEVGDTIPNGLVIVIDALDECAYPRTVETMLTVLFDHVTNLPVRFFLTSRPEPAIANTFLAREDQSRSILHLHNVEEHLVKADIETYLTTTLAKLSLQRSQIKQLAERAGVLFICAATLARYLLAAGIGASTSARLTVVLTGGKKGKNMMDHEIDLLYKIILDGVLREGRLDEDEVELIKQVIWTVACVREPATIGTLARLLNVDHEQVSAALQPLRSILQVSEGSEIVSTLHASFPEFMLSSERSGTSFYCNKATHNEYLARRCFELMTEQLKFNICDLETSYRFDKDVPHLEDRAKASISSELFYACRYWAEHLSHSSTHDELVTCLDKFLHEQLLFWMEVLNLKGYISSSAQILGKTQDWLTKTDRRPDTSGFIKDAREFVTAFAENPVRGSTPHIYISTLPLVPVRSKVWKSYWRRTRGLLWIEETQKSGRDGALIMDRTIRLLDVHSGTSTSTFQGHTGATSSVAFSPDGSRIVAGSRDHRIWLWDSYHGTPLSNPLRGHTDVVSSVAFSPDGTHIVSGSHDCTIRMWDVQSGIPLGNPLRGHTDVVSSVAFSPDGTHIVSGSHDCTIRMWDVHSGIPLGSPFQGHTGGVTSVAFSPDGTYIVSGSLDSTFRVWDLHSGTTLGSPFQGHTRGVTSIAFSPDGTRIVSGSWDNTIRVWDVCCGTPVGNPFTGHRNIVTSVAFSPDGTHIVSGSWDRKIQVWDVHSGTSVGSPFEGHTREVTSVAFSPDGTYVVSSSWDCPIRVWKDLLVPDLQARPFGRVNSDSSGWLVDCATGALVFWLPRELHDIFPRPPNTLTISPRGPIKPNLTDLSLGASWTQCYDPSDDNCI